MTPIYNGEYINISCDTQERDFIKEVTIHIDDVGGTLQFGEEKRDLYERRENLWIQTWGTYEWEDWIKGLHALADELETRKNYLNV